MMNTKTSKAPSKATSKVTKVIDTKAKTEAQKAEVKKPVVNEATKPTKPASLPKNEAKKVEDPKNEAPRNEPKVEVKKETPKAEAPKSAPKETAKAVSTITQIVVNGKPLSAGAQVREMFTKALEAGKIKAEQVKILTDADKTKEAFGLRYAMLKPATDNPEDRKVNGFARYGKATVKVSGKDYFICNDWYKRNIPHFKEWIDSLK